MRSKQAVLCVSFFFGFQSRFVGFSWVFVTHQAQQQPQLATYSLKFIVPDIYSDICMFQFYAIQFKNFRFACHLQTCRQSVLCGTQTTFQGSVQIRLRFITTTNCWGCMGSCTNSISSSISAGSICDAGIFWILELLSSTLVAALGWSSCISGRCIIRSIRSIHSIRISVEFSHFSARSSAASSSATTTVLCISPAHRQTQAR